MKHLFRTFLCLFVFYLAFLRFPEIYASTSDEWPPAPIVITYYVATTGKDNNPGTQAAPFRTIQKAINKVAHQYEAIKIAEGRYVENIEIFDKGVTLVGI